MNTKLTLSALLIAALPLTAQADSATERALVLNTEPLSAVSTDDQRVAHGDTSKVVQRTHIADNGSEALANARLRLHAEQARATAFAMTDDDLGLARQATTG